MSNAELTVALVKARQEMRGTVYKAGRNDAQRFSFAGHAHVIMSGARDALLKHGLALVQTDVEFAGETAYKTSKGEATCWRWRGKFVLAHSSGGAMSLVFEATTQANDKAGYVASTALDRTAHLRVLELAGSDEENPEHDPGTGGDEPTSDVLGDMVRDLSQRGDRAALVQWARDLASYQTREDKRAAWSAFGQRCKSLSMDPADVAGEARGKAA